MTTRLIAGSWLGLVVLAAASAHVPAQTGSAVKYESTFSDYKPFREQGLRSWTEVNKEVADNPMGHPMGAAKGMAGHAGHDMGATKSAAGPAGAPDHHAGTTKDVPRKTEVHRHDGGATKEPAGGPTVAMVSPGPAPIRSAPSRPLHVTGTAVVQAIDKANARIKLTHDPIAALNWPKLTLFFRLKDRALADRVKQGDRVGFSLERQDSGFVISGFHKTPAKHDAK